MQSDHAIGVKVAENSVDKDDLPTEHEQLYLCQPLFEDRYRKMHLKIIEKQLIIPKLH